MSHTNVAWGAVEEHCPGKERPGSATEAELWLNTVMTGPSPHDIHMTMRVLHCRVGFSV